MKNSAAENTASNVGITSNHLGIITKQELAAELRIPVTLVQYYTSKRKIPAIRLGHKTVRYNLEKVRRAIERFEIQEIK